MKYISTRDKSKNFEFKDVFINAMVTSAISNAKRAEDLGLSKENIWLYS